MKIRWFELKYKSFLSIITYKLWYGIGMIKIFEMHYQYFIVLDGLNLRVKICTHKNEQKLDKIIRYSLKLENQF